MKLSIKSQLISASRFLDNIPLSTLHEPHRAQGFRGRDGVHVSRLEVIYFLFLFPIQLGS